MIRRVLVATALALLTFAGAASASVPGVEAATVALDLSAYGPSVLTPGDLLTASATVSNSGPLTMSDLNVTLAVTSEPIKSSLALQQFLDNPQSSQTHLATTIPVTNANSTISGTGNVLPPGDTVTVDVTATPTQLGFPVGTAGVYGVVFAVAGPLGAITTRTAAITWYDAPINPLRVAFLATASGSAERVAQVTSAASVTGAALAIDPVTVTDASQASALTAGREVFSLPSGNPDITSLAHSTDDTLITFALDDAANNTAPPLQSLPWLATIPAVDAPTVSYAVAHGATAAILDVAGGARLATDAPVVDVTAGNDQLAMLVPNLRLSTVLATYRPGMPDAAARLVAEAALVAQAGDGVTPVVVAPGEAWQLTAPGVSKPASDLLAAPWVVPVSVHSVISGNARDTFTAPEATDAGNDLEPGLIQSLARQLVNVQQLARTAEDPNTIYVPGGRTLLAPLALNLRTDHIARATTYQGSLDTVNTMVSSLYVAEGSDVNLIAASGNVPVTLHNDLSVDATVTVVMRSSSPNLVVDDNPVVVVPAGGDYTAHIAVTGVKSANVTATVSLQNADGDVVASPQVLRVRVRADWGNAVTAIFTIGVGLLLVAGLIRTVRRGRRSSRMAPVSPSGKPPTGDTDAGGGDG